MNRASRQRGTNRSHGARTVFHCGRFFNRSRDGGRLRRGCGVGGGRRGGSVRHRSRSFWLARRYLSGERFMALVVTLFVVIVRRRIVRVGIVYVIRHVLAVVLT